MPAQAGIQYAAASQSSTTASGYWIIRFSRMMTAVFVGDTKISTHPITTFCHERVRCNFCNASYDGDHAIIFSPTPGKTAMAALFDPVVILSAARTPLGRFMGELSPCSAHKLGSHVIGAALERAKLAPEQIDEVLMGNVLPAGQGQAPARQAARGAGLPDATGATTINKVCGSGMKATMLAHDIVNAGSAEIVLSGGMESMSNAPYLLPKARAGYRAGHDRIIDHMMMDGLEDAYETGRSMGDFGEATAEAYQFTRKDQDAYAMETLARARKAVEGGAFKAEIAPITLTEKAGPRIIANDEHPLKVDPAKIPALKPAFRANGTITPAASSANADGAAALILAKRSLADRNGMPVLAEIKGHTTHSQEPQWFTTAPIPAIRKLLDKVGWSVGDVDLFEINEAFAVVAMAAAKDLGIPREKLNINGGACALGHPIGATGARLIVTLLHALEANNLKRGIASLCIGGGEATAIAVERIVH
jgi:acetyl-CoA C-acetyltransferase